MIRTQHRWQAAGFLAPFTVVMLAIGVFPVFRAAYLAASAGWPAVERLAADRAFWFAVVNTAGFTIAFVSATVAVSLALALVLNERALAGRGALRGLFFSSYLVGPVYVAVVVTGVLARDTGMSSGLLPAGFDVLATPWLAMPVVLVASVWGSAGWGMVYLLAALQSVDPELLDAARVDGASGPRRFWEVTLREIWPTVGFVAVASAIGGMQLFELPYILFQGPGPGNAGLTVSMVLFSAAFEQGDLGYASLIGWVLTLAMGGLSGLLVWGLSTRVTTTTGDA